MLNYFDYKKSYLTLREFYIEIYIKKTLNIHYS
jgi:hypothetical protein